MNKLLKQLDQECQTIIKDPQYQTITKNQYGEDMTMAQILSFLKQCSMREITIFGMYSNGILDTLIKLTTIVPTEDQELTILELLMPFWGIIVAILKNTKVIQSIQDKDDKIITLLKQTIIKNIEWLSCKLELEQKQYVFMKLLNTISIMCNSQTFSEWFVQEVQLNQILKGITYNIDKFDIVDQSLKLLIRIAHFQHLIPQLIDSDIFSFLKNIYQMYTENITILYHSADLTSLLALNQAASSKRIDLLQIMTIQIQELEKFKANDSIVERNIASISAISFQNQHNIGILIKQNVTDIIIKFARDYIDSPRVCISICQFFNSITYKNIKVKEYIGSKGCIQIIHSIMLHYLDNNNYVFNVVKAALKAIGNAIIYEENGLKLIQLDYVRHCIDFIDKKMVAPAKELDYISNLMIEILNHICTLHLGFLEQTIQQGLVEFLLKVLNFNRNSKDVTLNALDTLGPFLTFYASVQIFYEFEGFKSITDIMAIFHSEFDIQTYCIDNILSILNVDLEKIDLLMGLKIQNLIIKIMQQHLINQPCQPTQVNLFNSILSLIQILSSDSVKCRMIWTSGFLELAFQIFQTENYIQKKKLISPFISICEIYSQMQEASLIITKQGSKAIFAITKEHLTNYDIIDESLNLVLNLIEVSLNLEILLQNSLSEIGLAILYTHIQHENIVQRVLQWFERISLSSEQLRQIICSQCLDPLIKIQETCTDYDLQNKMLQETIAHIQYQVKSQTHSYLKILSKEAREYLIKGVTCKLQIIFSQCLENKRKWCQFIARNSMQIGERQDHETKMENECELGLEHKG